tara:strand:+ start:477 stop:1163 length:687 start_codon:yes stop_codon:yes gene_type:complete
MSWNNTVRCGHCYGEGHNKRTCPVIKATIAKRLAADPNDVHAKYAQQQQSKGNIRRCSYCNLKGHNRRTCGELIDAKFAWKEKAASWRLKFTDWAAANGIGPGTLVEVGYGWGGQTAVHMVKGFSWNRLNPDDQVGAYPAAGLVVTDLAMTPSSQNQCNLPYIEGISGGASGDHTRHDFKILSPVKLSNELILNLAPQWWLDGSTHDKLKDKFANRHSPNHYENQFEK